MTDGIKIEGLQRLIRALDNYEGSTEDLKAAFSKIGKKVVDDAKALVPVRTGKLRNSIKASKRKNAALIQAGSARIPYAKIIEFGWPRRGIEPALYLHKARDKNEDDVLAILVDELNAIARKNSLN